jgi:hypothetical protein
LGKVNVESVLLQSRYCLFHFRAQYNREPDLAEAGTSVILLRCPIAYRILSVGHSRRRKQALDEHNDRIRIRTILEVLQSYLRLERPLTNSALFVSLKGRH